MLNILSFASAPTRVPVSQCDIWQHQRHFFSQVGVEAWNNQVPFYITSNPYIANAYAHVILRFMQDSRNTPNYQASVPFYIVELGSGSGTFGFYLIKRLLELCASLKVATTFVYVMSDFALKNIEFCQQHPALQPFIEQGVLDFALYDTEASQSITLLHSGVILASAAKNSNPLIVLANYVFDSIPHDVFRIVNGQLQAGIITKDTKLMPEDGAKIIGLKQLDTSFAYEDVPLPYYNDEKIDAVLLHYLNTLPNACFSFPISSLRAMHSLMKIANHQLLVIASDKAYTSNWAMQHQIDSSLVLHGDFFSMSVNFNAIGQYFKECGGDYFYQTTQQGIVSSLFLLGRQFDEVPETYQAAQTYLDNIGHNHIYKLTRHLRDTQWNSSLETLIAGLSAACWDTRLFDYCLDALLSKIKSTDISLLHGFTQGMAKIAANFYYVPGTINTIANIGLFFQEIRDYASALHYYLESLCNFKPDAVLLYNMGFCCYMLNHHTEALELFNAVVQLEPQHITAKGWIAQIKSEITTPQAA